MVPPTQHLNAGARPARAQLLLKSDHAQEDGPVVERAEKHFARQAGLAHD